jgi:hypothetical protein
MSWQVSGTFHHEFNAMAQLDSDELVTSVLSIRGGGPIGCMVCDLNDYIGSSKARSWGVLVFSILTDAVAVTLMKTAQDESSVQKLVLSFFGFFIR